MRVATIVALWVAVSVPTALVVSAVIRATRGTELSEEVEFYLKGLSARHDRGRLLRRVRIATVTALGIAVVVALSSGLGRMPSRVYAVADQTRALFGAGPGPHPPPVVDVDAADDDVAAGPAAGSTPVADDDDDGSTSLEAAGETTPVSRAPDITFTEPARDGDDDAVGGTKDDHRTSSGVEVHRGRDDESTDDEADEDDADEHEHRRDRDRDREHHDDDAATTTTTAPPDATDEPTTTTTTTEPPAADEPPAGDVDAPPADRDGDGIEDGADRDADGDGIENADDDDVDGDEQANTDDADIDGDGVANADDPTPYGHVPEDDGHDDNEPPAGDDGPAPA
jgi:hypothetical protein